MRQQEDSIPLLGRIAAGAPIWVEQNFEDNLPIPPALFGGGELFALHVLGDSMMGAGIRNGDIAIIQRRDRVENGEIAAVLVEQEATLKRVYLTSEWLILKSENTAFKDLKYPEDMKEILSVSWDAIKELFEPGIIGVAHEYSKRSQNLWMSRCRAA